MSDKIHKIQIVDSTESGEPSLEKIPFIMIFVGFLAIAINKNLAFVLMGGGVLWLFLWSKSEKKKRS